MVSHDMLVTKKAYVTWIKDLFNCSQGRMVARELVIWFSKIENVQGKLSIHVMREFLSHTWIEAALKVLLEQECIPVGCILPAAVAFSPATHAPPPRPRTLLPCMPPATYAPHAHSRHACPPPCHTHPTAMHAPTVNRQMIVKTLNWILDIMYWQTSSSFFLTTYPLHRVLSIT